MSEFSDYTETNILNTTLKGIAFPQPTNIYIALYTTDPTDANSGSEVVDGTSAGLWSGYTRMNADSATTGIATGWSSITDGVISNAQVITFPANASAGDVIVTHIGILDAVTGGSLLYHTPLTTNKTVQSSDVLSFDIAAITVTVA
jgi:hypothetical protein